MLSWCYNECNIYIFQGGKFLYGWQGTSKQKWSLSAQLRLFVWAQNKHKFERPFFILGPMVHFPFPFLSFFVTGRTLSSDCFTSPPWQKIYYLGIIYISPILWLVWCPVKLSGHLNPSYACESNVYCTTVWFCPVLRYTEWNNWKSVWMLDF